MNVETLFIRSLDDLHLSVNSADEYEVLRSAGIIRQLFLDSASSLVDQVNRKHRLKLLFEVIEPEKPLIAGLPVPELWCAVDSIDPRRMPNTAHRVKKSRDDFFGLTIGCLKGTDYTVRETVKFIANVLGAIHAGSPADIKEKALDEIGKIYFFSNISILLQHLRSIGRIILETLKPLRYKVLGLERFENAQGISIHMALALHPHEPEKELYIFDIGTERNCNRLTVYVDTRQELTFRAIDSKERRMIVRAGPQDCAYRYGVPEYFLFEVGTLSDEVLLSIEAGGWSFSSILKHQDIDLAHSNMSFVIGSDVNGVAETHMSLMEQCVYDRCLKADERYQLREYFENRIRQGYKGSVYFKGNQFLYSARHPNFIEKGKA